MTENTTPYAIFTPETIPAKRGGSKKSAFPIDLLKVGEGFLVPADKVQSCRSLVRSRKAANPLLDIVTRATPSGEFLVIRRADLTPTAPATTPVAETTAS